WMAALTEHPKRHPRTVLLGFLSAEHGLGEIAIVRRGEPLVEARLGWDGRLLSPGSTLAGEPLRISASAEGDALPGRRTREALLRMRAPRLPAESPSGWCSWYDYYTKVTERAVEQNLAALSEARATMPVRYVQLDDGYPTKIGDWLSPNAKFSSGLSSL